MVRFVPELAPLATACVDLVSPSIVKRAQSRSDEEMAVAVRDIGLMYLAKLEQRSSDEVSIEPDVIGFASRTSGRSESNMPTRYDLDEHGKIRPDPEDFDAVKETPDNPLKSPAENAAYKYQLAQARKLIRLYELGQLPIELMREMEKLAERSRGG